jgi:hypothetical protein
MGYFLNTLYIKCIYRDIAYSSLVQIRVIITLLPEHRVCNSFLKASHVKTEVTETGVRKLNTVTGPCAYQQLGAGVWNIVNESNRGKEVYLHFSTPCWSHSVSAMPSSSVPISVKVNSVNEILLFKSLLEA